MGVIVIGESTDVYHYNGSLEVDGSLIAKAGQTFESSHGAKMRIQTAEAIESALTGATDTVGSNLIPAGAMVFGVLVIVTELIVGPTTFTIGDGTDADKWGTGIALTAGTKTTHTAFTSSANPIVYTSAANVVLTGTGGSFSAGGVRAVVFYADFVGLLS